MSQIHPLCRCALACNLADGGDSQAVTEFRKRFGTLLSALAEGAEKSIGQPMLIAADRAARNLEFRQLAGGREVHYVVVANVQPMRSDGTWRPRKETLTYRDDVAGTDLIYDVTGEFMQGKARPFVCDLASLPVRIYAILPFQLESLAAKLQPREDAGGELRVSVEFREGSGRPIEGRLPFAATLVRDKDRQSVLAQYAVTSPQGAGTISMQIPADVAPGRYQLVVRSQLQGEEIAAPAVIDVESPGRFRCHPRVGAPASRRNPQPFSPAP